MQDFSLHGEKDKIEDKEQGKGTNFIKFTLSKASKYMHEPLTPPVHYCSCGTLIRSLLHLFGQQKLRNLQSNEIFDRTFGHRKAQLPPPLVKAIMRDMRNLDKIITSQ